jgi:cytidylate kinase
MRLPETLTVALFGRSAVGKSVIATALARRYGVPVRQCGEIAKQRARDLGCGIAALASEIHDEIDNETRRVASTPRSSWMLIEGRYLDLVLGGVQGVFLIELTCSELVRAVRKGVGDQAIVEEDESDFAFRTRLLDRFDHRVPELSLDTSIVTEGVVEDTIVRRLCETIDAV